MWQRGPDFRHQRTLAVKKRGYEVLQRRGPSSDSPSSRDLSMKRRTCIPRNGQAFVGPSAFAHKGGMHVHAVNRAASSYEHIEPESVGNERRVLVSELSGRSNIIAKTTKYNLEQDKGLDDEDSWKRSSSWRTRATNLRRRRRRLICSCKRCAGTYRRHFTCLLSTTLKFWETISISNVA